MGRLSRLVTKPHCDDREVNARLEQVHGRRVPNRVGRDPRETAMRNIGIGLASLPRLSLCATPERLMGLPWAFGSKGESDGPSSCRSQDRSILTVCRQSGTERFLRPLPRIWTDMRDSRDTSWTWRPAIPTLGHPCCTEASGEPDLVAR